MLKYDQIPRFPKANYTVDVGWSFLNEYLEQFSKGQTYSINLNPDYQREHVWTKEQQSAYLEFILQGGESGNIIYWNHPNWMGTFDGTLELVDGKQRLEAVQAFLRDEVLAFGHYFSEMEPKILRMSNARFTFKISTLPTRKDVLNWYIMINSGGTPHTQDEINRVRKLLVKEP
jgi:hypothetical protein